MLKEQLCDFWDSVVENIKERISSQQYETWFSNCSLQSYSSDRVEIHVPSNLIREWIEDHYLTLIRDAIQGVSGESPRITFVSNQQGSDSNGRTSPLALLDMDPKLNAQYNFENFIIGPSNRLAHAAAIAVSESLAEAYNPLFIHSNVGLGKTHLQQAICHRIVQKNPNLKIAYLPCEDFMHMFISAVQSGLLEEFRQRFRSLDVLFIDDIHFLAQRERSQEEFFHTFNALYNSNKQIVLSSDSYPKDIPNLEDRIVSRFKWGLVVEIEAPSYETRIAILKKKAQVKGWRLPAEVIEFLAENISTNVRELEGAIVKLVGYASLLGKDIDLDTAKDVLKRSLDKPPRTVTFDQIIKIITKDYGVSLSDLQSKRRSQSLVLPRQIAMFLCRQMTNYSLQEIGGYFGGRDHTTVKHAIEKIARLISENQPLKNRLESINSTILSGR